MRLSQSVDRGVVVIRVNGRIDASASPDLEAVFDQLIANETGPVVLDAADVDYISSAGLRVLLVALKRLTAKGRRLALSSLNPEVMDVVKLTGFDKLLDCYATLDDATLALNK